MLEGLLPRARTEARRREILDKLAVPAFPEAIRYLWTAYWRIRARRESGPIGLGDIADFIRLSGVRLAPWEVEIIECLDNAWREAGKTTHEGSEE